jgi:non-ribosomal peptide synthase protein (TIGR01720 family)
VDPAGSTVSLALSDEPVGNTVGASGVNKINLEINCVVVSGILWIHIAYNGALYRKESIESQAENYKEVLSMMIRHCCGIVERQLTVSDFKHDRLTMDELEIISNQFK